MESFEIKVVIISPHPDDELIGCYSLLKNKFVKYVVYIDEYQDERMKESKRCAEKFGFKPIYLDKIINLQNILEKLKPIDYICVPDITDMHPLHKQISVLGNFLARELKCGLIYYSVDMAASYITKLADYMSKRAALDAIYQSQRSLWEMDHKYFLFEGLALSLGGDNFALLRPLSTS
jgi:hypothetical protein